MITDNELDTLKSLLGSTEEDMTVGLEILKQKDISGDIDIVDFLLTLKYLPTEKRRMIKEYFDYKERIIKLFTIYNTDYNLSFLLIIKNLNVLNLYDDYSKEKIRKELKVYHDRLLVSKEAYNEILKEI